MYKDIIDIIKSKDQKIFELENRLKECENGYEGTLYLESCKLHDAEKKIKELTAENERLIAADFELSDYAINKNRATIDDIVCKMQNEIKGRFAQDTDRLYSGFKIHNWVDRVAEKILKGVHGVKKN